MPQRIVVNVMTKEQTIVDLTPEEIAAIPPPYVPTPEEVATAAELQAQKDLRAAAKIDAIFTDIANDTIAQLLHKIEVQFPNPAYTNQQQKLLKVCLVAAALSLRGDK